MYPYNTSFEHVGFNVITSPVRLSVGNIITTTIHDFYEVIDIEGSWEDDNYPYLCLHKAEPIIVKVEN